MTIGDTVFVRWYGKIVEGMIVENSEVTPALASMVVVRIPVQGVRASALYTPEHVYSSAELAGLKEHIKLVPTDMPTVAPTVEAQTSELYRRLQEFKLTNWDAEHNHIKLTALNDYYDMWREYVADKRGVKHKRMKMESPATHEEAMNPKHHVSDTKMADLKLQLKKALAPAKPRKRNNTVKITQLSFWE